MVRPPYSPVCRSWMMPSRSSFMTSQIIDSPCSAAVASSMALIMNAPSPLTQTTGRRGSATLAPMTPAGAGLRESPVELGDDGGQVTDRGGRHGVGLADVLGVRVDLDERHRGVGRVPAERRDLVEGLADGHDEVRVVLQVAFPGAVAHDARTAQVERRPLVHDRLAA